MAIEAPEHLKQGSDLCGIPCFNAKTGLKRCYPSHSHSELLSHSHSELLFKLKSITYNRGHPNHLMSPTKCTCVFRGQHLLLRRSLKSCYANSMNPLYVSQHSRGDPLNTPSSISSICGFLYLQFLFHFVILQLDFLQTG